MRASFDATQAFSQPSTSNPASSKHLLGGLRPACISLARVSRPSPDRACRSRCAIAPITQPADASVAPRGDFSVSPWESVTTFASARTRRVRGAGHDTRAPWSPGPGTAVAVDVGRAEAFACPASDRAALADHQFGTRPSPRPAGRRRRPRLRGSSLLQAAIFASVPSRRAELGLRLGDGLPNA